jgi:SAM-dependent methyltransferase
MKTATVRRTEEIAAIEKAIDALGEDLTILEAGCGRRWLPRLSVRHRIMGIDVDESALRIRQETQGDLVEYRVGSLCDDHFGPGSFDVIYCSFVLEHVQGVSRVLDNFVRWLKPGGVIVLRVPDHHSVYGFLAKHTPHWFHVVARRMMGDRNAGKPGFEPFPVVYEYAMSREGIQEYFGRRGRAVTLIQTSAYLESRPWLAPFFAAISWMSLGALRWRHNNLTFIIR